ncbi:MAG: class I SAM-dependent methyltransferase [Myxococcales bacterium]|nr:MAG: class I SAM-dependent methyltransferase [Myxococcales bacterium]
MAPHVCPWWLGYVLVNPLRRLLQDPRRLLEPFVSEGMTVLEPGPGMGYFTLELARRVGARGRVVAVDIQPRMLKSLRRRAEKTGLAERIDARLASAEGMGLDDLAGGVDFALVFAMVHELPDIPAFFRELARAMKPGGKLLLAEPRGHVSTADFDKELALAEQAGFRVADRPTIRRSLTAVLVRVPEAA